MKTPLGTEVDIGAGHIVLRKGHSTPPSLLGPCLLWPWSPISATAELLLLLWPPYAIGQAIIFLPCGFFLVLLFCPRLISAVADWMSTVLPHMVCP